jgi:hypothetical protein
LNDRARSAQRCVAGGALVWRDAWRVNVAVLRGIGERGARRVGTVCRGVHSTGGARARWE